MTVYPSIDLMNGKAVQLVQGNPENKKFDIDDIFSLADKFSSYGEFNVIDLDAALGKGDNSGLIKILCAKYNIRVGGGIRTVEKAREYITAGARKIIIGTQATPKFLEQLPKDRIIVAIDSKKGKVVDKGWTESTGKTPFEKVEELNDYCAGFLYTYVDKEGMMEGTDFETVSKLRKMTENEVIAAGGISSIEEIKKLDAINVSSVLGMAMYTGKITIEDLKKI